MIDRAVTPIVIARQARVDALVQRVVDLLWTTAIPPQFPAVRGLVEEALAVGSFKLATCEWTHLPSEVLYPRGMEAWSRFVDSDGVMEMAAAKLRARLQKHGYEQAIEVTYMHVFG